MGDNKYSIDDTDKKILSYLIKDSRTPYLEIARQCGVSGAAIHQRVKKMEQAGVITGSRLQVRPEALGLKVCAIVGVSLSDTTKYKEVFAAIENIPEVAECHFVTGHYAMFVKLYCIDHDHLMQVLINTIQGIPYIQGTDTMISLQVPIDRQVWINDVKEEE